MKKVLLFLSLVLVITFARSGNVVFNSTSINMDCYYPNYVHQPTGTIVITGFKYRYFIVDNQIIGQGTLNITNYSQNIGQGLSKHSSDDYNTYYIVESDYATLNFNFEILNQNFIVGSSIEINRISQISKLPASYYPGVPKEGLINFPLVGSISIPAPPVNGAELVCSSPSTYTISGIPSGSNINWQKSSNLIFTGSSSGSQVQVESLNSFNNGDAWIQPTVQLACGNSYECPKKIFWIGKPNQPFEIFPDPSSIQLCKGLGNDYQFGISNYNSMGYTESVCWDVEVPGTIWGASTYATAKVNFPQSTSVGTYSIAVS